MKVYVYEKELRKERMVKVTRIVVIKILQDVKQEESFKVKKSELLLHRQRLYDN